MFPQLHRDVVPGQRRAQQVLGLERPILGMPRRGREEGNQARGVPGPAEAVQHKLSITMGI